MPYGFLQGLIGLKEGEVTNVTVQPEDAYGIWNETALNELFELVFYVPYYPRLQPYPYEETLQLETLETVLIGAPDEDIDIDALEVGDTITYRNGTLPNGTSAQWTLEITNVTSENITFQHVVVNETRIPAVPGKTPVSYTHLRAHET